MKNQPPEKRLVQVHYTIIDGEHEYRNSFFIHSDGTNEEQAFQELAEFYACDDEDEQDIMAELQKEGMAMIGCRAIKDVIIRELDTVTVLVRGGVIQDIQNIPAGIRIRVQDYDIENLTDKELQEETETDEEGHPCVVSIWENIDSYINGK